MVDKKQDLILASYILGIISIVMAISTPLAGLIFGVIGFRFAQKQNDAFAKKAKKLNLIGVVINVVLLLVAIVVTILTEINNSSSLL